MTSRNLHWQTTAGEWQFTGNNAQQTVSVGYAAAYVHVPMDDFAFSVRITPAWESSSAATPPGRTVMCSVPVNAGYSYWRSSSMAGGRKSPDESPSRWTMFLP
ncbi:TPA: hypothetical protein EYP66_24495 [Candidatus Poribacteria bacterium]|nr:hypothetical protein [Candidatus Poribacteria bacterium]